MKITAVNFNIFKLRPSAYHKNYFQKPFFKQDFDSFTFSGNIEKQKEIEEEKQQIKRVLQEAKDNNSTISVANIIKKVNNPNLTESKVFNRIHSDSELDSLWAVVRTKEAIKFNSDEMAEFEKAAGDILRNAKSHSQKVSVKDMCDKLGVSSAIIYKIIGGNDEYISLFKQVRKYPPKKNRTTEDIKSEEQIIKQLLLCAIENNEKASIRKMSEIVGVSQSTLQSRIKNNPQLRELYEQVKIPGVKPTKEASMSKEKELEELLEQCVRNNRKMKLEDILNRLNITITTFYNMLSRNEKVNSLWQRVKKQEYNRYSKEELTTLDDFIFKFIADKEERGEKTTLLEIAQYFDVSKGLINKRVHGNPSIKYHWSKVQSQPKSQFDSFITKEQTSRIITLLKEVEKSGEKTTKEEIAQELNLSKGTVQNRIKNSVTATKLWNGVKSQKHTHYGKKQIMQQNTAIKNALESLIKDGKKANIAEISRLTGIDRNVIKRRIESNGELNEIWQKVIMQ